MDHGFCANSSRVSVFSIYSILSEFDSAVSTYSGEIWISSEGSAVAENFSALPDPVKKPTVVVFY